MLYRTKPPFLSCIFLAHPENINKPAESHIPDLYNLRTVAVVCGFIVAAGIVVAAVKIVAATVRT